MEDAGRPLYFGSRGPECIRRKRRLAIEAPGWQSGSWYETLFGIPSHQEWEQMLGTSFKSSTPRKGAFTMDNTLMEMKEHSLIMLFVYRCVEMVVAKGFGGKRDYSDPTFRMLMSSSADCALRSMAICGGINEWIFKTLLNIANIF